MADRRGGMTSGHRGRQPVPEATSARVYRVRSGVHARRRAANIARVADALLFVLARVFAKRRSRTALSSTRPRCDLKSEASGAKLSLSANEKQFSEKISQSISRAPVYGRSYVHINDAAALSRRARCSASKDALAPAPSDIVTSSRGAHVIRDTRPRRSTPHPHHSPSGQPSRSIRRFTSCHRSRGAWRRTTQAPAP